ncbi:SLC13 family permease [Lacunimicrobium album]
MITPLIAVLSLLAVVIVMFIMNRPRMDAVAIIAICALPMTGAVSVPETLAGFSDPNIVLIAALFVIGDGLVRTGVARRMGEWLVTYGGSSQTRLTALLMAAVAGLGSMMSSTAVTAIFIPVVLTICRRTGFAPGQLMMPLSCAALISGMMTLVATAPNLVINAELIQHGHAGFRFFSFTPFGLPILILGIVYMLIACRWLPNKSNESHAGHIVRPTLFDWIKRYNLAEREYRLRVQHESPLIGQTLQSLEMRAAEGANLVAIQRGRELIQPTAKTSFHSGDILFVDLFAPHADAEKMQARFGLEKLPLTGAHFTDHSQEIGMAELFVPADSSLIGKTIVAGEVRTRFGFSVLGIRRGSQAVKEKLSSEVLKVGDTLLVIGPWKSIRNVRIVGGGDLLALNLPAEVDDVLPAPKKVVHALVILMLVVVIMVLGVIPNVQAALIGCLLMGLFRCIDFESAYRSIDWKTLILIVGMIPFSTALQRTGGVEMAAHALMNSTAGMGNQVVLASLFLMTALLGLFISNTATAILMGPIALTIADQLNVSPYPFAMIVALAASAAFMTPVSTPVNTMVVTPGNYRFIDFVKVGVPFTLIVMVVSVLMVPWLLPF